MKVRDLVAIMEDWVPENTQESWDRSGFQIGNLDDEITGICIGLDLDLDLIEFAKSRGLNMVINHHPILFENPRPISFGTYQADIIRSAIKNDMNVLACHTNLDKVDNGVSDALADYLGFDLDFYLEDSGEDKGYGKYGCIDELVFSDLVKYIKDQVGPRGFIAYGDMDKKISKLGLIGGSGSDFIKPSIDKGLDLLISSEFDHYEINMALYHKLNLIDLSHYWSEFPVCLRIKEVLEEKISDLPIVVYDREDKISYIDN